VEVNVGKIKDYSKMNTVNKRNRIFLLHFLFLLCGVSAYGHLNDQYSYKTTVTVRTGSGSVYATYNDVDNYNYGSATTSTKSYSASFRKGSNQASVTLNATPAEGYRFVKWEDNSGSVVSSTNPSPNVTLTYQTSGISYNTVVVWWIPYMYYYNYKTEQEFKYFAYFDEEGTVVARVASGQESIGSAVISEESFSEGDEVTLVASNINGSELVGWAFDHWEVDGVNVSEKNEIKVVVPNTEVTYVAHFSQADSESYCFIRNKKTGKYLKISGKKDYSVPSSESSHASFNGSFTLVSPEKAVSDPACVFLLTGTTNSGGLKNASLVSQGKVIGNVSGVIIKKALTIRPVNVGTYSISTIYTYQNNDIDLYFRDNSGTPDMVRSNSDASTEWEILTLNKANLDSHYFGAAPNALLERDGKYYTTLYTTFPYELQSGRAYYISDESIKNLGTDDNPAIKVYCNIIEDGKVPENFPVILEFESTKVEDNKILPLPRRSVSSINGSSLVRGHISLSDGTKTGDGNMYVLSVGSNSGLGFYKLKTGTAMTDNKVYAYLDEEAQTLAKNMSFSFGDDFSSESGIITNIQEMVVLPESLTGAIIYDLQGRQVKNPTRGVYIVNGKKFVIK